MTTNNQRSRVAQADSYSGLNSAIDIWFAEEKSSLTAEGKWNKWTANRIWRSYRVNDILRDHGERPLSPVDKLVLQFIAERYNEKDAKAWPSLTQVSLSLDISEKTVRRSLDRLEWVGALHGRRQTGRRVEWMIVGIDGTERTIVDHAPSRKVMTNAVASVLRDTATVDTGVRGTVDMGVQGSVDTHVQGGWTPMSNHISQNKPDHKKLDNRHRALGAPSPEGYSPPLASEMEISETAARDESDSGQDMDIDIDWSAVADGSYRENMPVRDRPSRAAINERRVMDSNVVKLDTIRLKVTPMIQSKMDKAAGELGIRCDRAYEAERAAFLRSRTTVDNIVDDFRQFIDRSGTVRRYEKR